MNLRLHQNMECMSRMKAAHQLSTGLSLLSSSFLLSPVQFGKKLGKQRAHVPFQFKSKDIVSKLRVIYMIVDGI